MDTTLTGLHGARVLIGGGMGLMDLRSLVEEIAYSKLICRRIVVLATIKLQILANVNRLICCDPAGKKHAPGRGG
jgi:hypothetical protein